MNYFFYYSRFVRLIACTGIRWMCLRPDRNGQQTRLLQSQLPSNERRLSIDFRINPFAFGHVHSGHGDPTVKVCLTREITRILHK